MAAYVIADMRITDPESIKEYQKHVPTTLAPYGGRFLIRGGAHETVEGHWKHERLVVLEFPDMSSAKAWYASTEYQAILPLRVRNSEARFLTFVQGVA